jgi:hypothetical protein
MDTNLHQSFAPVSVTLPESFGRPSPRRRKLLRDPPEGGWIRLI